MEKRSVLISKETYYILTLLSAKQDKYLYQLIDEAVLLLDRKYQTITENSNEQTV